MFRDLSRRQTGFDRCELRMSSPLRIGKFLITGFTRAPSAARDAHGSAEKSRNDSAQTALHARRASSAGQRAAIGGSSTGPSPARATLTYLRRQLFCLLCSSPLFYFPDASTLLLFQRPPRFSFLILYCFTRLALLWLLRLIFYRQFTQFF